MHLCHWHLYFKGCEWWWVFVWACNLQHTSLWSLLLFCTWIYNCHTLEVNMANISCKCKNPCNRRGDRRGGCPCLNKDSFCSRLCACGTDTIFCTNRPDHINSVLADEMGVHIPSPNILDENTDSDVSSCLSKEIYCFLLL